MDKSPSYSPVMTLDNLPPSGPYVSFEQSIGASLQPGEVIDIDYAALQKTADTIGLRSEVFAKTAITLCGKTSTAILQQKAD